jgi:hypothetical protein
MTFQYKKASPFDLAALPTLDPNPQSGFDESRQLAYRAIELNDTSVSEANALEEVWDPIIEEMNSRQTGKTFYNPSINYRTGIFNEEYQEQNYSNAVTEILSEIETNDMFSDLRGVVDRDLIYEQAATNAREANDAFLRNSPVSSTLGTFVGTAHAVLDDPVLVGSMLFGGAKGVWQMALQEMAIGAASEAVIQTKVKEWYESTGQEYTDEKFRNAVLYGGAIGFATPFAFKGAGMGFKATGKAVNFTVDQLKQGISVMRAAGVPSTARGRFAEELADEIEAVNNANPLEAPVNNPLPAQTEHMARVEAAAVAAEKNAPPAMPDQPKVPTRALTVSDVDKADPTVYPFDPNKLQVDAEKFQFKSGGDEFGVTEKLQGVTKWNPIYAEEILVWERADGTQFVVDGHQRTGLARRIMASDPNQKIKVNGKKLNEKDGWTAETARAVAALKNISQGSGTGVDAAKVLKEDPTFVRELPPKSALVRDANGLVELSDETFLAVVNGVVEESYGAVVGRLIKDEGMQQAAIAVLAKTQPDNKFQAESIVRQVIEAGAETRTQETLFGEEIITESFFAERAKILDATVKQLRRDKAAFNSLVNNRERLEQEGNKIVEGANKRRADNDSQAIAILQAVANRKGPISDALTAAARTARDTGSFTNPISGFVETVRRGIRDGEFDGAAVSDGRSLENDTPQGSPRPAEPEPNVELFDEPSGIGAQRQANQLETDTRNELVESVPPERVEGFQQDKELLDDFKKLLDEGADEDTLFQHPAAVKAIEAAEAIPATNKREGFGTDEYRAEREFNFDGETVKGYDEALFRHFELSTTLAYREQGIEVPDIPVLYEGKAVILVGPPAAGKSTLANPIAVKLKAAIPDSDEFKKTLPEYEGGLGAAAVHAESSGMAKELVAASAKVKLNMVIPKVGEDAASIEKLRKQLKDEGYDVALVNMDVSYENALVRMFKRFVSKGRLIGADYMKSIGNRPTQTYNDIKGNFDRYVDIDNNGGKEVGPRIKEDNYGGPEIADAISSARPTEIQLEPGRADGRRASGEEPAVPRPSEPAGRAAEPEEDRGVGFGILAKVEAEIAKEEQLMSEAAKAIPVVRGVDDAGNEIVGTATRKELLDEIDQDKKMLDRLRGCVT